ncbi:tyrosinase family protein [Streptomyces tsukubensis]|uniref:Tyrosinase n=1 Tax=Streptomyces tsukubensis TaxID=83656 RepID=A0A1V4A075_9ACTN|nr:tyrosinase family protein [Streptomyces tsukubensis]OON72196.1 tyrosinase [Streptomyces tsukubensis]QFR97069.1 tyrosinase family protein [Streptomyces tsukubensis]
MVYTRKNQRHLTKAEKRKFVAAVLELKRRGDYDAFVRTHVEYYVSDGDDGLRVAHMAPSFLPWHRQFLLEFERALRKIDPSVTVPYWDWTKDRTPASSLWSEDFLGGDGRRGDRQVTTGPFAHARGHWNIVEGVSEDPFLAREFGRPRDPIDLPTGEELARATAEGLYDVEPWDSTSDHGFRNKLEGWTRGRGNQRFRNHNRVHRWIGGNMLGGASVNDPVFWLHHSFIDLVWSRWQRAHPDAGYLPAKPPPAGSAQYGRVAALEDPMPPWNVRPSALLGHGHLYRYA